jgi:hypothetical protein
MSTLKELVALTEATKPKFILVNCPSGDMYDLAQEITEAFGWKDKGQIGDLVDADDVPEDADEAYGVDRDFFESVKDDVYIFGEFEPSKEDALKAFMSGDVLNRHA